MVKRKTKILYPFIAAAIFLILANTYYKRIDLTSEKRYTLSENTKQYLENLESPVYLEIYLAGELPPAFTNLQQRTIELLEEFNTISGGKINYRTLDPTRIQDNKKKDEFINKLMNKGIQPTSLNRKTSDESLSQQIIFPGILVWNKTAETSVNLLKNNPNTGAEENINNSIEALEYELISAIRVIFSGERKNIGFLTGHEELSKQETADFGITLASYYNVKRINCKDIDKDINKYSAIIIAQPRKDFSEKDKYIIDQYIMNGGKTLWLIDQVHAFIDSLKYSETIPAVYKPLNTEDILFRYGVRINPNLILDGKCALIPIKTSLSGETPKFTPAPWYYSPLASPKESHPIGKNINPVRLDFTNSIDTVGENKDIKKEIILQSSEYTRLEKVPCPVSLKIVEQQMTPDRFNQKHKALGVLLSGKFTSAFRYRNLPGTNKSYFRTESKPTKMIVISDGDIIKNKVSGTGQNMQISPLGYDRYTGQTFGNKNFLLNAINYLCDDQGWMELRAREFKLRLLDKTRLKAEKRKWQTINTLLPLALLIIVGSLWLFIRKRKYSKAC